VEWLASIPQYLAGGLAIGAVYGLIAAGFSLTYNASKVINFAQGQFVVYGGLLAVSALGWGWPKALGLPAVVAACILLGAGLQGVLRGARKASNELTFVMVTIGIGMVLQGIAHQAWGTDYLTYTLYPAGGARLGGAFLNTATLTLIAVTIAVCIAMWTFLYRTMGGKAMRACASDPRVAQTVGIQPGRVVLMAYIVSAGLGGLAGVLVTPALMMSSEYGVLLTIKGFTAAIVGGLTNPFGAVVGGILLGLFEGLCVGLVSSEFQDAYAFIALMAVLLVRPQGLFGRLQASGSR
jgi:branched-chain amino acid transport system permease protein